MIGGERAPRPRSNRHTISSGPSRGRDIVGNVAGALGAEQADVEALVEANVEPATALLAATRQGEGHAFPHVLVLPVGICPDELRWLDGGDRRPIAGAVKSLLGVPPAAGFEALATAAYERLEDHAVAAVAVHV